MTIPMTVEQAQEVATIRAEHHLHLTCQTLAENSAGGAWVEIVLLPDVCWSIIYPNDQRFVQGPGPRIRLERIEVVDIHESAPAV